MMKGIVNGRLVPASAVPVEPAGTIGVFETLRLQSGRPVFFAEHARRYAAGCDYFGLRGAPETKVLREAATELVRSNGLVDGVLRWSAWMDELNIAGWSMQAGPPRPHMLKRDFSATIAASALPAAGPEAPYKHLGRVAWRDQLTAARAAGFDEVLLGDQQGRLVEGAVSNVFLVQGGGLLTPALDCWPLPGITRAKVLALAGELCLTVEERTLDCVAAHGADEIFVTNALIGLRPVVRLDDRFLPAPGPVTARLQQAWQRTYGWA
ncbi:MAG: aminotransferase class IV [Opitutaceae bacterium]|nr:aminotransferase class IV [Opitutaceae bacterium]